MALRGASFTFLLALVSADELRELRPGEAELQEPGRWGTTFTLLQCWGRL